MLLISQAYFYLMRFLQFAPQPSVFLLQLSKLTCLNISRSFNFRQNKFLAKLEMFHELAEIHFANIAFPKLQKFLFVGHLKEKIYFSK